MNSALLLLLHIPGLLLCTLALAALGFASSSIAPGLRRLLTAFVAFLGVYALLNFSVSYSLRNFFGVDPLSITTIITIKNISILLYVGIIFKNALSYALVYILTQLFLRLSELTLSPYKRFMINLPVFTLCLWSAGANLMVPLLYTWTADAAHIHEILRGATGISNAILLPGISVLIAVIWFKRRRLLPEPRLRRMGDVFAFAFLGYFAIEVGGGILYATILSGSVRDSTALSDIAIVLTEVAVGVCVLWFLRPPRAAVLGVMTDDLNPQTRNNPAVEDDARRFSGHDLTARELEIARLILQGMSNKEICQRLDISHGTVKNHVFRIFRKLGIQSRFELTKFKAL